DAGEDFAPLIAEAIWSRDSRLLIVVFPRALKNREMIILDARTGTCLRRIAPPYWVLSGATVLAGQDDKFDPFAYFGLERSAKPTFSKPNDLISKIRKFSPDMADKLEAEMRPSTQESTPNGRK